MKITYFQKMGDEWIEARYWFRYPPTQEDGTRVTLCHIDPCDSEHPPVVGLARCSPSDQFEREHGRIIAVRRAASMLCEANEQNNVGLANAVLEHYFNRLREPKPVKIEPRLSRMEAAIRELTNTLDQLIAQGFGIQPGPDRFEARVESIETALLRLTHAIDRILAFHITQQSGEPDLTALKEATARIIPRMAGRLEDEIEDRKTGA